MSGGTERVWRIGFTDAELDAIYAAIEGTPHGDEEALDSAMGKIVPLRVGDPTPAGALEPAQKEDN